jgi:hypothetical protein
MTKLKLLLGLFLFTFIGCKSDSNTYNLTVKVAPNHINNIKTIAETLTKRLNHFKQLEAQPVVNSKTGEIYFVLKTQDTIEYKVVQTLCTMSGNLEFVRIEKNWLENLIGQQSTFGPNIIATSNDTNTVETRRQVETLLKEHPALNQWANLFWQEANVTDTNFELFALPKVGESVKISTQNIVKSAVSIQGNQAELIIELDDFGTKAFADLSTKHSYQPIPFTELSKKSSYKAAAFMADDKMLMCPYILAPIIDGKITLSNSSSLGLLKAYAVVFSNPTFPAKAVVSIQIR